MLTRSTFRLTIGVGHRLTSDRRVEPARRILEKRARRFRAERPRERKALAEVASQVLELEQLAPRLHAFGDHIQPQAFTERNNRSHDLRVLSGMPDAGDERAVDLQRVKRELMEIAER